MKIMRAGVTLDKLSASTVDDCGEETFVTGGALERIMKSVELEQLAVYWDSDSWPWNLDKRWEDLLPAEWSQVFKFGTKDGKPSGSLVRKHSYILQLVSGNGNSFGKGKPLQKAIVNLDDVTLCLSMNRYRDILKLADNFAAFNQRLKCAHLRPPVSVKSGPRAWRNYSCKAVSDQTKKARFSTHEYEDADSMRRTTIGNGPPESVLDWTKEVDSNLSNENTDDQSFSRKHWRLLQCQNGLRIFEELVEVDLLPKSCSRAMKIAGIVEATCEEVFELVMSMDATRFEWDCSFQYGSLVEELDEHTAILYHRLQLDWFPMLVWPRDLCYVRNWRRNDDRSYVVLFQSREHENCGSQPGFVRAHIESGGYNIYPLKSQNGRPRTLVQHHMQIDLRGWGVGYISSFQQYCLLQMLNSVSGIREYFSQTGERHALPRIPVMVNMSSASRFSRNGSKLQTSSVLRSSSSDQINENKNAAIVDEYSDEDDDFQIPDQEASSSSIENRVKKAVVEDDHPDNIDLTCFSGNLRRDDRENGRDSWKISDGNNFRVRSKRFCHDKSKIPSGKHLMDLVAVDWFKGTKRMDHLARRRGCAAQVASEKGYFSIVVNMQVPGSTHYSMVYYFVTKELIPGSLLQRFVDGDDEFRTSRLKLIPSVPKGSWFVRQSVGSTPCLLGKAVDCNYIRGPKYLEIDVDIGSSTVANGVLGLVIGVMTTLVVDMAFLVQGNTTDELPERLIGAIRLSHIELSSAIVPNLDQDPAD